MKRVRSTHIKINNNFRDEICSGCNKPFRAGWAASGYAHVIFRGYNPGGLKRDNLICPSCIKTVYRVLGHDPDAYHKRCPMAFYSFNKHTGKIKKRPDTMYVYGKTMKYNRKKLYDATKKFALEMKLLEPWSNVDYFKIAGLRK